MNVEEKSSFELVVSAILFQLIWVVSTTDNALQVFSMSIVLFLVSLVIFSRFLNLMVRGHVKNRATILARNSDLLIFSFLGLLVGSSSFYPEGTILSQARQWLWVVAVIMMLGIAVRLMLVYRFTKPFEQKTEEKEVIGSGAIQESVRNQL